MRKMGFGEEVDRVEEDLCPTCGTPVDEDQFRDQESRREFEISGLCQECQDDIFD